MVITQPNQILEFFTLDELAGRVSGVRSDNNLKTLGTNVFLWNRVTFGTLGQIHFGEPLPG